MAKKILVVLTSYDTIESTGQPTGWYLPEFAHPYDVLAPHAEIVVASPKGGSFKDDSSVNFLNNKSSLWENTKTIKEFLGRAGEFDAIFYPGGHGPVFDLRVDEESIQLIQEFYKAGKTVAAVCHGPIVFSNVKIDGEYLVKGKNVTGFTDAEEEAVKLAEVMPVLLESDFIKKGAKFQKAEKLWGEKVVVDGQLITGQNPASAKAVGDAILKAIS
ncbi:Glyoxalase 3 [Cladobotryum mycophilum]|uniref:D-lactate dehydratase n=1 Tax=Cladobotryum mycophilum TaxID=491253 RepID=A0ABR0SQA6_9HYPO